MGTPLVFALDQIPVAMVYATHRIIRDCNTEFAELFGYSQGELIGSSFSKLFPAIADFVRTGEMWRHNLTGHSVYHDERIMVGASGRFWCRVNGRSRNLNDPFTAALYYFEPINRPIAQSTLKLTGRQRQILTLVAQGKTNALIAAEVGLSRRTVEAHRLRLGRSAGATNSAELVAWFLSQSLTEALDGSLS